MSLCIQMRPGMVVFFVILSYFTLFNSAQAIIANKYAAIVVDFDSGEVLHEKNANTPRYPASLTKIMTLYMVFEAIDNGRLHMAQRLPVSRTAAQKEPSRLGLKPGQTITVENAILSLVTKSANDVATVLAEAVGGNERDFCRQMTHRAHTLGMYNTAFFNASGLPHPQQTTTANDMAILSRAMMIHFPHYYHYFNTHAFHYKGKRYRNHNRLLKSYPGTDGIKTGYIRASGFNLAASASRHGKRLIAIVMGGKTARSRDRHIQQLLNNAFFQTGVMD